MGTASAGAGAVVEGSPVQLVNNGVAGEGRGIAQIAREPRLDVLAVLLTVAGELPADHCRAVQPRHRGRRHLGSPRTDRAVALGPRATDVAQIHDEHSLLALGT